MKLTRRSLFGAVAGTAAATTAQPQRAEKPPPARFIYEVRSLPTAAEMDGLGAPSMRITNIRLADVKDAQKYWISSYHMARLTKSCKFGDTNPARCVVVMCSGSEQHTLYGRQAEDFLIVMQHSWHCPRCAAPAVMHHGLSVDYSCKTRTSFIATNDAQLIESIGPECLRRTHGE